MSTTLLGVTNTNDLETNLTWANEAIDQGLLAEVEAVLAPVKNKVLLCARFPPPTSTPALPLGLALPASLHVAAAVAEQGVSDMRFG